MSKRPLLGSVLLLITTVIWGAAFIAQKAGMDHVGPFAFTVYRNVLAGVFLLAIVLWRCRRPSGVPAIGRNVLYGLACGLFLFIPMALQQVGLVYTSTGVCAFLTANYVLAVPILGLFVGRRPGVHVWIGAAVAVVGTYLICVTGGESAGVGKGELLSVACAIMFGVEILVVERCVTRPDADLPMICCVQFFTCAALGLPFLLLPSERALLGLGNIKAALGAIAFCGILSSGVAYSLQNVGQKMLAAAPAAIIMSLESAFAALFGWMFLGEVAEGRRLVGCILVFAAAFGTQLFEVLRSGNDGAAGNRRIYAWLRFFRVVNIPTVPGDVLAGAAACILFLPAAAEGCLSTVAYASVASVFIYMFGLADNDIVGAGTDKGRPIPDGEITLRSALVARQMCIVAAIVVGAVGWLPPSWWVCALLLVLTIARYNRTKSCILMGLCRGLNVLCGAAAVCMFVYEEIGYMPRWAWGTPWAAIAVALVWTAYIAGVTKYSEGEETDPARKRFVGFLIGALIYMQITVLLVATLLDGQSTPFLIVSAAMLVLLRILKHAFPKVSAS